MRVTSLIWDLTGLGAIAGLVWKLALTAIVFVNVASAALGIQVRGALDPVVYRQVVSPEIIRNEVAGSVDFFGGAWRYFTGQPYRRCLGGASAAAFDCALERLHAPEPLARALLDDGRSFRDEALLIGLYLASAAGSLVAVVGLRRWMQARGHRHGFEELCQRLLEELRARGADRRARAAAASASAPEPENGTATALAVAGGIATLAGLATGGLGLLLLGPLLVGASRLGERDRAPTPAPGRASDDDLYALAGTILEARGRHKALQTRLIWTAASVAFAVLIGNYAAAALGAVFVAGLPKLAAALSLPVWSPSAVVALAALAAIVAAATAPRALSGYDADRRYWLGIAFGSGAAVVLVAAATHWHALVS